MSLKGQVEAVIYAAEEPVTVEQIAGVLAHSGSLAGESPNQTSGPLDDPMSGPASGSSDASAEISPVAEAEPVEQQPPKKARKPDPLAAIKVEVRRAIEELMAEYSSAERGIEIRALAGGYRIATKPEHHDVVRAFARSLKPPVRLSLPALETLAVVAYKQPITVPEISEIRGVDSGGVIATLLDRKLITTAGRKQVIGRPILYKTTREFLLRFGLKDLNELPSMEEFEKLMNEAAQEELLPKSTAEALESRPGAAQPTESPEREAPLSAADLRIT